MTPEFTAGFNAGIKAARKVAKVAWLHTKYGSIADADAMNSMCEELSDTISALTVPSDLVAVPREPTEAMLAAGGKAIPPFEGNIYGERMPGADGAAECYRAMIAATEERG